MSDTSLVRLRRYAEWLDEGIRIPVLGWRIGFDAILGLIPGVGDAAGAVLGGWVVLEAARLRVPAPTMVRMLLNLALDASIGALPLLGDLLDFVWKANTRNLALLERHRRDPHTARRTDTAVVLGLAAVLLAICAATIVGGLYLAVRLLGMLLGSGAS